MKSNNISIDEMISKATKEAIKEYDKEKNQERKRKVLHNTRLLMKNYNSLKEHIENVSEDVEEIMLDYEGLEVDEIWILSIKKSKIKTIKMLGYIDSALDILEKRFRQNCEEYKYKAFILYYKDKKTNEEIQEALECGKNSPKKWSDSVIEELSLLLWGVDALGI